MRKSLRGAGLYSREGTIEVVQHERIVKVIPKMCKEATQTWKSVSLDVSTQPTMCEDEPTRNRPGLDVKVLSG